MRAEALIAVIVVPPSVVRSSRSPLDVDIRHDVAVAQRTVVSPSTGTSSATGCGSQVMPPSVVFSTVLAPPTAYPVIESGKNTLLRPWSTVACLNHVFPPSLVRWIVPPSGPLVSAKPVVASVKKMSLGVAGEPVGRVACVPGSAWRPEKLAPPLPVWTIVPSESSR